MEHCDYYRKFGLEAVEGTKASLFFYSRSMMSITAEYAFNKSVKLTRYLRLEILIETIKCIGTGTADYSLTRMFSSDNERFAWALEDCVTALPIWSATA